MYLLDLYDLDYPAGGPKGYAPWKPDKRTAVLRSYVIDVLNTYRDYWPLGPRQVGYVTIGRYSYLKSENHMRRVSYVLDRGRRAGGIPRGAIADGWTPDPLDPFEYESLSAFRDQVCALAKNYSSPLLAGQPVVIEIWVETASLAPQVARVAHPYGISVFPSSGDVPILAKRNLALRAVRRWNDQEASTLVLHIGDYDHKGVGVFRALEADVIAFLATGHCREGLSWPEAQDVAGELVAMERLAITPEIVDRFDLPTDPVKLPQNGAAPPGPALAFNCQAEALNPEQLETLLVDAIETHLDLDVLAKARTRSDRERQWAFDQVDAIEVPE